MPTPIEKGMINTGFDDIADTIDIYSQTAVAVRSDGHHEPSAVVTGINSFQPKIASESCKLDLEHDTLTIGGVSVPLSFNGAEGDVYVDIHGNITTS